MTEQTIDMFLPQGGINGHAGQATMVEASRAAESVRAQVILARQFPRSVPQAIATIEETFGVPAMANRAFYSFPKGGKTVTGSTIHLAKAVAQAWGNIDASIHEMDRTARQSTMMARAWDLQTNQVMSTTFISEHAIDAGSTRKEVTSLRDIYDTNANMANRRLRAMIESVIPAYVFDIAKEVASRTLREGGGVPLPVRIGKAIKAYAGIGVDVEQLEAERGREHARWSDIDMAHLLIVMQTIQRGETTIEEVFPPRTLTVADVLPMVPNQPKTGSKVEDTPGPDEWEQEEAPSWPPVATPGGAE